MKITQSREHDNTHSHVQMGNIQKLLYLQMVIFSALIRYDQSYLYFFVKNIILLQNF